MAALPNTPNVSENSARKLRQLRRNAGLTQHELARRADVSQSVIARAERGHEPRPAAMVKVAAAFKLQPSDIWPVE